MNLATLAPMVRTAVTERPSAPPLRVLHLQLYFHPDFTGEGLYMSRLLPLLQPHGISSTILITRTRGQNSAAGTEPRVIFTRPQRASRLSRPRSEVASRGLAPNLLSPHLLPALRQADLLHMHCMVDRAMAPQLLSRMLGIPVVQSCTLDDGIGQTIATYAPRYRPLVRAACRRLDAVVAISPALQQDSAAIMPPGRVHLIPQGVDLAHFDRTRPERQAQAVQWRRQHGIAPQETMLLYVGGITPRKDVRFLVQNHLPQEGVRLVLLGPVLDQAYADALDRDIAGLPPGQVLRIGYMADPAAAYAAADGFVFASLREGFGNVLLEAMAASLPVLARRLPGVTDRLIGHGESGMLFSSADEYRAALALLIGKPDLRHRLGAAARALACAEYGLDVAAARYAALYRQVLAARSGRGRT